MVAVFSLVAALTSVYVSVYAIRKGNKNSSIATLVVLTEALREAWGKFILSIKAVQKEPQSECNRYMYLSELMNVIEAGCAIQNEKSLSGVSKDLMKSHLVNSLELLVGNDYARSEIPKMLTDSTTFEHIKKFLKSQRNYRSRIIIPVEWYEL